MQSIDSGVYGKVFIMVEKVRKFFVCLRVIGVKYTLKTTFATLRQIFRNLTRPRRINNKNTYEKYIDYIDKLNTNRNNIQEKVVETYTREAESPKLIAWYTPQYYDNTDGEWDIIIRGIPQFTGHYQPNMPYNMKCYGFEEIEVLKWQASLAKQYGVYGFAFEWNGEYEKRNLFQRMLKTLEIDIKYCFKWTIDLVVNDLYREIKEVIPFFQDERYIKVEGRPVLIISGCNTTVEQRGILEIVAILRNEIKRTGMQDAYLVMMDGMYAEESIHLNVDAIVENPLNYVFSQCDRYPYAGYMLAGFDADLYDIDSFVKEQKYLQQHNCEYYRSVLVGFDDSICPRSGKSKIIMNNTPEKFKSWLETVLVENDFIHNKENNFVFINSWNEWDKGCHLEPDTKDGYEYLRALRQALEEVRQELNTDIISNKIAENKKRGIIKNRYYIHCIESMGDVVACEPIARYLKKIDTNGEIHWIVKEQYRGIVEYNPYVKSVIGVHNMKESVAICNKLRKNMENIVIDCHYDGYISCKMPMPHINPNNPQVNGKTYLYYGGLLQAFALAAGLPPIDDAPIFWQSEQYGHLNSLPERYVVFHCNSAMEIKDWTSSKWNMLADMLVQDGYNIVEIGLKRNVNIDSTQYYDCTKIRDFQEIASIIKRADCFVGVDSGFAHIANCFKVQAVLIFGRYKNFRKPMVYTGAYKDKNVAKILYAESGIASEVELEKVYSSVKNWFR